MTLNDALNMIRAERQKHEGLKRLEEAAQLIVESETQTAELLAKAEAARQRAQIAELQAAQSDARVSKARETAQNKIDQVLAHAETRISAINTAVEQKRAEADAHAAACDVAAQSAEMEHTKALAGMQAEYEVALTQLAAVQERLNALKALFG